MTRQQSKARRAKAAKTEAKIDEKPTPVSGQNPVSRLKALGGGKSDQWNSRISERLFLAMPDINPENAQEAGRASLSGLLDINSTDPIEGMLSTQIIAAHEASMHLRRLAWHPEQSFEVVTRFLELAEKAARTVGILTERLDQHRGRGQQQITVKYVNVNADQALVAGSITMSESQKSCPARPAGNLLTTGKQKAMEILDGDPVREGAITKDEHRPHAKRSRGPSVRG
jgi:hypothetical protein